MTSKTVSQYLPNTLSAGKTGQNGDMFSKYTLQELKQLHQLPARMQPIKRSASLTSNMYHRLLDRYNRLIVYHKEYMGFLPNVEVWVINENALKSNSLGKDVFIALQLHIYCRQLGFPLFILASNRHHSWIRTLTRLLNIISGDADLENKPFLLAKVMVCLAMEYTIKKKFGKAATFLKDAEEILAKTEASDFHGWYHLASAYFYNAFRLTKSVTKPDMKEKVMDHLQKAHQYFVEDSTGRYAFRLESSLTIWWMFLVKTNLTKDVKCLMPDDSCKERCDKLQLTLNDDNAMKYYQQFFSEKTANQLLPADVLEVVHTKTQKLVKSSQDNTRETMQEEREKEDEAASQTMQQGYEEFAEQFERGNLPAFVQGVYLDEGNNKLHVFLMSYDREKEDQLLEVLNQKFHKIVKQVIIRKTQFRFAGDNDDKTTLSAEQERCRTTHGQLKSTFGPGSTLFTIDKKHKDNVLLAGDIHIREDIPKKVAGIEKTPPSTTLTCLTTSKEDKIYALTCQHLFMCDGGYKTENDCCVLSQVNYQSKPNDTPSELFLVGEYFTGIYSVTPDSIAEEEQLSPQEDSSVTKLTGRGQQQEGGSKQKKADDVKRVQRETRIIDLSAVKVTEPAPNRIERYLSNDNDESVQLEMHTKSSQIRHALRVQKIGATSGFTTGEIISTKTIMKIGKDMYTRHAFIVSGKDGKTFAAEGDSGALVTPVIGVLKKALALGFVFKYSDPDEHGCATVLCLNFKESFNTFNKVSQLDLTLCNPPGDGNACSENEVAHDTADSGIAEGDVFNNIHKNNEEQSACKQTTPARRAGREPSKVTSTSGESGIEKDCMD